MSPDEQDALLARLEAVERQGPGRFVRRVAAMAILGYGVLFLVMGVLLCSAGGAFWLMVRFEEERVMGGLAGLGVWAVFSAWSVFRSLWVRLGGPEGMVVKRKEAPALFAELKRLRRRLRVGRIARVYLTPDLNAAACEVPRFGIFGWSRRYLVLGLPLLQAFPPEELGSVIAHEIGHFSREHNGITRWLCRVRLTWQSLLSDGEQRQRIFLLGPFLRWWWPRFNAHAFVLSRRQEYEADQAAARAAGAEVAGRALLRLTVLSRFLDEEFWPEVQKLAVDSPMPPLDLSARLAAALRRDPGPEAVRWLREGLAVPTNNADTHPCLRDRLVEMGFPGAENPGAIPVPPLPGPTAAAEWLGPLEQRAGERFSSDWAFGVREVWKERHEEAARRLAALEKTEAAEVAGTLTPEERWERIAHVVEVEGAGAAEPMVRDLLALEPAHAAANFLYGRILLDRDDAAGMECLERAICRDIFATPEACGLMHAYLQRKGRLTEAKEMERRAYDHEQLLETAQRERNGVNHRTSMEPPDLEAAALEEIRKVLAAHPEISRVAMARAVLTHLREHPYYLIAVTVKVPWWKFRGNRVDQQLVDQLLGSLPVPGQFYLFVERGGSGVWYSGPLGRAIRRVPGSLIYPGGAAALSG
jgi:Zn-dependent protease with chaperone function